MKKVFGAMDKSLKTFGKAMSQISEDYEILINDDDSIGAQSHAQVGSFSFAVRTDSLRDFILLDNQSSSHVFCNRDLVSDSRRGQRRLSLESNGGKLSIADIANFEGFEAPVWFSQDAITNILSFS